MRIIGGRLKGLGLASVGKGDAAAHLRPTTDRVRESIFNLLVNGGYGDPITDAIVLDLFAGTGALGLEALSRGAAHVTFIDSGRVATGLIRDNIAKTRTQDATKLQKRDVTRLGPTNDISATLVFLDPPYGTNLGELALTSARKAGWIAPGALVVWEDSSEPATPPSFEKRDARRYGDTYVTILSAEA